MLYLDLPAVLIFPFLFVLGSIVGSFANVCIYRFPTRDRFGDQLRTLLGRSQCPRCRTAIGFDNIPVFGWLFLRGRCRHCRMWISPRYPLIEALSGGLWVLVFWLEIPSGLFGKFEASCVFSDLGPQSIPGLGPFSPEAFVLLRFFYHMVLIEALLVASFIDIDLRIIPDGSTLPAMLVGVLASLVLGRVHLVPVWFQDPNLQQSFAAVLPEWFSPWLAGPGVPAWISAHPHLHGLAVSLAGLVVGGGIVWLVRLLGFWMLRQEAMGFGDVILMALIGSFLGWQATIMAFFLAPAIALVVVVLTLFFWRDRTIPFGPYLSLGALLTILAWRPLFDRTRHLFELGALLLPIAVLTVVLFAFAVALLVVVKWLLGIRGFVHQAPVPWRPADQTNFFKAEKVDRHTCRWRTRDWDGCASAHGTIHQERWRWNWKSSIPRDGRKPPL